MWERRHIQNSNQGQTVRILCLQDLCRRHKLTPTVRLYLAGENEADYNERKRKSGT